MLEQLAGHLDAVAALAPVWGFAFAFFFMAVESSFIPFPSEIVMIPAGFMAARGELSTGVPFADCALAVAAGTAGSVAGAWFNYALSARLGEPFLRAHGRWFFLKPEQLDRAKDVFNRYGAAATFACRLVPVIRQLISIPAGIARMPAWPFTLFTALGAGIWSAVLAAAGFALGRAGGELTYLELVRRGKDAVGAWLPWLILGALALAACHVAASKWVMGGKAR